MNKEEKKSAKPSRNFFLFYCIVLFLFAAILITFSYLSQERLEDTAEGFVSRLEEANSKLAEADKTIVEQKTSIDSLSKQVADSTVLLTEQEKKLKAADYMWKLEKTYYQSKFRECRSYIALIDSEGLRSYLSEEALTELKRIEKITKGA